MEEKLEKLCDILRDTIRDIGIDVKGLKTHSNFKGEQAFQGQHGEMIANIMLSYRHLEDARMRLGKAIQQIQGGVSILDKMKEESKV